MKQSPTIDAVRFFMSRPINIWGLTCSAIALLGVFVYFSVFAKFTVFPESTNFSFTCYTDSASGGNSEVINFAVSDKAIDLEFRLAEGFSSPYVGLFIYPVNDGFINMKLYNQIQIEVEGENVKRIGFSLYSLSGANQQLDHDKELCFNTNIDIAPIRQIKNIDLRSLKIPDWWSDVNNLSPDVTYLPDLKHVKYFIIGSSSVNSINTPSVLRIHSISFVRNNRTLAMWLLLIEALVVGVLVTIHFIKLKRVTTVPVTISYKPVDIEHDVNQLNAFIDHINQNFSDIELTLEKVSNHTGINQRRIANYIQHTFGCNFKTYVNQIRINESKRLLHESELNMGEISFKVGFGNQSHFNRVFKALEGKSPSEYRGKRP